MGKPTRKFTRNNRGRFTKLAKFFGIRTRNQRGRFAKKETKKAKKSQPRNKLGRWLTY